MNGSPGTTFFRLTLEPNRGGMHRFGYALSSLQIVQHKKEKAPLPADASDTFNRALLFFGIPHGKPRMRVRC
jgi:hypothetical protein